MRRSPSRLAASLAAALLWLSPQLGWAQGAVQQDGPITAGHAACWSKNGHVADCGTTTPLGNATGTSLGLGAAVPLNANWLESLIPGTTAISQEAVINPTGRGFSGLFGIRASDYLGNNNDSIALGSVALCNTLTASTLKACFSLYGETRRSAGSTDQYSETAEFDMVNFDTVVPLGPYTMGQNGLTIDLLLGSGRPDVVSPTNASAAIGIIPNGARFDQGIIVAYNALNTARGIGGLGVAMLMAPGQSLEWLDAGGVARGEIFASAGGTINLSGLTNSTAGYQINGVNALAMAGGFTQLDDPSGAGGLFLGTSGAASRFTVSGLPSSAGAGGLYVCADATGAMYRKGTCP